MVRLPAQEQRCVAPDVAMTARPRAAEPEALHAGALRASQAWHAGLERRPQTDIDDIVGRDVAGHSDARTSGLPIERCDVRHATASTARASRKTPDLTEQRPEARND
jgi:hypothetical protein